MSKLPYSKKALSYIEQLEKLKSRGLLIENERKALHLLKQISYYRLSGYWYTLLRQPKSDHIFKENVSFEMAFQLYCFDRELRKLFQSELEKIEVSVRAIMIYEFWHNYGPFWFQDPKYFKSTNKLNELLLKIRDSVSKSDEEFIKSFYEKYNNELPPACMLLEVSSFGNLSNLYSNLRGGIREKRKIANYYGLDENTFASWLHCFTYVRNLCAHHSRFWNKVFKIAPLVPKNPRRPFVKNSNLPVLNKNSNNFKTNTRVYYLLCMVIYLMEIIEPKNNLKLKFFQLVNKFSFIELNSMGFPEHWQDEPLWRQSSN